MDGSEIYWTSLCLHAGAVCCTEMDVCHKTFFVRGRENGLHVIRHCRADSGDCSFVQKEGTAMEETRGAIRKEKEEQPTARGGTQGPRKWHEEGQDRNVYYQYFGLWQRPRRNTAARVVNLYQMALTTARRNGKPPPESTKRIEGNFQDFSCSLHPGFTGECFEVRSSQFRLNCYCILAVVLVVVVSARISASSTVVPSKPC